MNKIEIKENKIFLNGTPFFPIGTGYYPRSTTYYFEEADFVEVEEDIKKMKELGYNIVLIFVPWPEIESIKGKYRFEFLDKLVDLTEKYDIFLLPMILSVGIGWNYFPYWVRGRDIYENKEILEAEINLVKAVVDRYKNRKCILLWDLALEMDTHVPPKDNESYFKWLEILYKAVKEVDGVHPVIVGSYNEIRANMPPISGQAKVVDIVTAHSFPGFVSWSDILRNEKNSTRCSHFTSFLIKINSSQKKPCFMESFGMSTDFNKNFLKHINYRDENYVKKFINISFHSSLISGSCGAIHYTFNDSIPEDILPFSENLFEGRLGAYYNNGKPKGIVDSIRNFFKNFKKLNYQDLEFYYPEAAILFNEKKLYTSSNEYRLSVFNSFILTKRAGIDIDFLDIKYIQEIDKYNSIFIPLVDETYVDISNIIRFINCGGKVYLSFNNIRSNKSKKIMRLLKESKLIDFDNENFSKILERKEKFYDINFYKNLDLKKLNDNKIMISCKKDNGELLVSIFPFEKYIGNIDEIYSYENYYKIYKEIYKGGKSIVSSDNPNVEVVNFRNRGSILVMNHDYYNSQSVEIKYKNRLFRLEFIMPGEVLLKSSKYFLI